MDDESLKPKSISLSEVKELLSKSFLYLKDSEYTLKDTNIMMIDHKEFPDEIIQNYTKEGKPAFTLSVANPKEKSEIGGIQGEKEITVRGNNGIYLDSNVNIITFDEKDLRYSMIINDKNITLEEGIEILGSLSYYN